MTDSDTEGEHETHDARDFTGVSVKTSQWVAIEFNNSQSVSEITELILGCRK